MRALGLRPSLPRVQGTPPVTIMTSSLTAPNPVSCIIGFYIGSRWKLPPLHRKLPLIPRKLPPLPWKRMTVFLRKLWKLPWKRWKLQWKLPWTCTEATIEASVEAPTISMEASVKAVPWSFYGSGGSFRGKSGVLPRMQSPQKLRAASMKASIITSSDNLKLYFDGNSC